MSDYKCSDFVVLPREETEAMHDAVMELLYKGVSRTETYKLLEAYIKAGEVRVQGMGA
jgi:hypothetical protein